MTQPTNPSKISFHSLDSYFADRVCELLPPELQEKFFRPLSLRGTQFIVHPFGVEYLELSEQQVSRTRKLVNAEVAFRSEKLRKAIQMNPDILKTFGGKGTPLDEETKILASRKHFESLSQLTSAQIAKYLRLRGAIDENGSIQTWLDKKSPDERASANEVLHVQLAE